MDIGSIIPKYRRLCAIWWMWNIRTLSLSVLGAKSLSRNFALCLSSRRKKLYRAIYTLVSVREFISILGELPNIRRRKPRPMKRRLLKLPNLRGGLRPTLYFWFLNNLVYTLARSYCDDEYAEHSENARNKIRGQFALPTEHGVFL